MTKSCVFNWDSPWCKLFFLTPNSSVSEKFSAETLKMLAQLFPVGIQARAEIATVVEGPPRRPSSSHSARRNRVGAEPGVLLFIAEETGEQFHTWRRF